ncbi:MAG: hypothetical protein WCF12_10090 [Propionicimonas sp.]
MADRRLGVQLLLGLGFQQVLGGGLARPTPGVRVDPVANPDQAAEPDLGGESSSE